MDTGVFDEGVLLDEFLEALLGLEVIIKAVLLLAAGLAGRAGNGIDDVAVLLKEHVDQGGLSASRRRGEHDKQRFGFHTMGLMYLAVSAR